MTDGEYAKGLEAIRESLYKNQPETMTSLLELIALLECRACNHVFVNKPAGGDPANPPETVTVCDKCGYEPTE